LVCAMLLLIAAIGTTRMACDEGRQAFTPPRGPFSLHPLVALVPVLLPRGRRIDDVMGDFDVDHGDPAAATVAITFLVAPMLAFLDRPAR